MRPLLFLCLLPAFWLPVQHCAAQTAHTAHPAATGEHHSPSTDSLLRIAAGLTRRVRAFDRETNDKKVETFSVTYDADAGVRTKVWVTTRKGIIRKLSYMAYDDALQDPAPVSYYFDSSGQLFCNRTPAAGDELSFYLAADLLVIYKPGGLDNRVLTEADALSQAAYAKFDVDAYLGACDKHQYSTFPTTKGHGVTLMALKDLPLRQAPAATAAAIRTLRRDATFQYLDRSPNCDSVPAAGKWVWYKVRTTAGQTGWVWGHPSGVKERMDEDD